MNTAANARAARLESVTARIARRIAARLDESAATLPHEVSERLRIGREQALARARLARRGATVVLGQSGGAAVLGGTPWWLQLASALPIIMLIGGLLLIERINSEQQIQAAAEIDAVILADDLPPQAFTDPGFGAYLRQASVE